MKALNTIKNTKHIHRNSQIIFIYVFLIILIIISSILDDVFFTIENFTNLVVTSLPLLFVSFAQTVIILTGGIDISVGAIVSLANVLCATLMVKSPMGFAAGLVVALCVGTAAGVLNGVLITKGKLQPIIATLATSAIIGGVALAVLETPGGYVHSGFAKFLTGDILGIPIALIFEILIAILLWILLNRTRFGYSILAIGGNENAAYSTGIIIDRVKIAAYALSGLLCAITGVYLSAQINSGDPIIGSSYTMKSITAVVVGGTALLGGKGSIIGSIAGVFILAIINNLLNLIGITSFYQYIFQGSILILALAIGSLRTRKY